MDDNKKLGGELEIIKPKRDYVTASEKQHLKGFDNLKYSRRELEKLGVIKPELKDKFAEASARFIHELTLRLRNDPKEFSNQELIVGAKQTADTSMELSKQVQQQEQIDWSKFSVEEFEKPSE